MYIISFLMIIFGATCKYFPFWIGEIPFVFLAGWVLLFAKYFDIITKD